MQRCRPRMPILVLASSQRAMTLGSDSGNVGQVGNGVCRTTRSSRQFTRQVGGDCFAWHRTSSIQARVRNCAEVVQVAEETYNGGPIPWRLRDCEGGTTVACLSDAPGKTLPMNGIVDGKEGKRRQTCLAKVLGYFEYKDDVVSDKSQRQVTGVNLCVESR
ncbi:hypothetical protein HD554DRAFT_2086087 [Boletus coccyginus]|nr:hypothetical protein HD554DRAFT_2086087 [Boletus coccyginus]